MDKEEPPAGEDPTTRYSPNIRQSLFADDGLGKAMNSKARHRMFGGGRGYVELLGAREVRRKNERIARKEAKRNARKK